MADENVLDRRREAFSRVSSRLAHMDDREVRALFAANRVHRGWGVSHAAAIGDDTVFVKRIPLTDMEHARPFSTKNLFRLPTYYNYGVGSAGFGAWRELVSHIKTTNWVLEGAVESFPLLYHHRLVRRAARRPKARPLEDYVRRWNGSAAVETYMRARLAAPYEMVLFLEHHPHTLDPWFAGHQDAVGAVVEQLADTITFLRAHHVVHFDVHFANVVTDGARMYLADFGLVLDAAFHLSSRERAFLARHDHYDYGELLFSVGMVPIRVIGRLPAEQRQELTRVFGIGEHTPLVQLLRSVAEHADDLVGRGVPLHPPLVDALRRYLDVIVYMADFFVTQSLNPRKNTPYDDATVRRLLEPTDLGSRIAV